MGQTTRLVGRVEVQNLAGGGCAQCARPTKGILGERENVLLHKAGPVQARVEARQEPTPVPTLRGESFSDERDERSGVDACLSAGRFFFKSENFGLRAHNEVI